MLHTLARCLSWYYEEERSNSYESPTTPSHFNFLFSPYHWYVQLRHLVLEVLALLIKHSSYLNTLFLTLLKPCSCCLVIFTPFSYVNICNKRNSYSTRVYSLYQFVISLWILTSNSYNRIKSLGNDISTD